MAGPTAISPTHHELIYIFAWLMAELHWKSKKKKQSHPLPQGVTVSSERCPDCNHPHHDGRACLAMKTQEIDDTVGLFSKPSGKIFTLVTGICKCGLIDSETGRFTCCGADALGEKRIHTWDCWYRGAK